MNLYRIVVPSTKNASEVVQASEFEARVERVASWLSEKFGGYTKLSGAGGWLSDTRGLIAEQVTVVESAGPNDGFDAVLEFCKQLAADWSQEAIGLQVVKVNMLFVEA